MVSVITPQRCRLSPILVTESGAKGNFCQVSRPESCHFLTVTSGGGTNWGSAVVSGVRCQDYTLLHVLEDLDLVFVDLGSDLPEHEI